MSGDGLPRVSMVTACLNAAPFLEETLESVISQGYPRLEYIVVDGGSTDGSLEIIRKYERWLASWSTGADRGQADAINIGLSRATGDVMGFVNADDTLTSGALARVADAACREGDATRAWVAFPVEDFDEEGVRLTWLQRKPTSLVSWIAETTGLHQPGVFWGRVLYEEAGGFDTSLQYMFDRDFFMRLLINGWRFGVERGPAVARFRVHGASKTSRESTGRFTESGFGREFLVLAKRYLTALSRDERKRATTALDQAWLDEEYAARRWGAGGPGPTLTGLLRIASRRPRIVGERMYLGAVARAVRVLVGLH